MGEERAKRIQEIDRLYAEVREYRSKENFVGLVNFVKRFPYIGPYNAMLVYIQKPGSRHRNSGADSDGSRKEEPGRW